MRINFYATTGTFDIDGDDDTNETVLKYIGSVDGSAAGAQDFDANLDNDAATTNNDSRKYIYAMTISESALADAVGSKGEYTGWAYRCLGREGQQGRSPVRAGRSGDLTP